MFIPNKTFHQLRVSLLAGIALLVAVIAWQSMVSATTARARRAEVDSLQVAFDTQADGAAVRFRRLEQWQVETERRVQSLEELLAKQGQSLTQTQGAVEKLQRNECTPETAIYVLTRDMVAVCRMLGVTPPQ